MAMIENNIYLSKGYSEIEVVHPDYRVVVLIDTEDLYKIGKVNITNSGYARTKQELLHRLLMGCVKGDGQFVDHINGNTLDNRRSNLRVTTDSLNKRNTHTSSRNNTGFIGVQFRTNGGYTYYRVSWRDLEGKRFSKQFNIGLFGDEAAFDLAKKCLLENREKFGYLNLFDV